MLIAVSATGPTSEDTTDSAFGRCPFFVFVDPDTMAFEGVRNAGAQAVGGAGTQSAQAVAAKGAHVVVTGNVGPNAMRVLQAAGIAVFTGCHGTVRQAIKEHASGQLTQTSTPTARGHEGTP